MIESICPAGSKNDMIIVQLSCYLLLVIVNIDSDYDDDKIDRCYLFFI